MVTDALALAIVTTTGFAIIYQKLPRRVRRFIEKYSLAADVIALILVYLLLGGTLRALMAGAICGLMISVLLHVANHRDDFLYLFDLRDFLKAQLKIAKEALNAYGKKYQENKKGESQAEPSPATPAA